MFVGSNVFAVTVEEFQRIASDKAGFEKFQIQLIKKYKAKNWDDLLYNKQTTDMDAEDAEVIKFILKKQEDVQKIASKMQNTQGLRLSDENDTLPFRKSRRRK